MDKLLIHRVVDSRYQCSYRGYDDIRMSADTPEYLTVNVDSHI